MLYKINTFAVLLLVQVRCATPLTTLAISADEGTTMQVVKATVNEGIEIIPKNF